MVNPFASVIIPPIVQAKSTIVESPVKERTTPGFMKIPEPITVPITMAVETKKPIFLFKSAPCLQDTYVFFITRGYKFYFYYLLNSNIILPFNAKLFD